MAKDPAFLFYPGDYLRDTQCLSQPAQVSYDRIMCEHMRNICISQLQLNFFTKNLTEDQKEELLMVLTKKDIGYQIDWVVESIVKRRAYSVSRSENRKKENKTYDKHMKTYDEHMVNENENENTPKIFEKEVQEEKLWTETVTAFKNDFRWKEKFCRDKQIKMPDLEKQMLEFLSNIELKEDYKPLKELKNHFTNTFNKNNSHGISSNFKSDRRSNDGAAGMLDKFKQHLTATNGGGQQNTVP